MEKKNIQKEYEDRLYKLLKRFAFLSRKFCDKYCVPDGLMDIMIAKIHSNQIPKKILYSNKLSYDYDYYAFTKSTKTLQSIIHLFKDKEYNFNEDVMMLVRSIFENHILSRYFRGHIDILQEREKIINDFIRNPLGVSFDYYVKEGIKIKNSNGENLGTITTPSKYKMGKEKEYYSAFYPYLCEFSHCSFGSIECYFDGVDFYYYKNNLRLEAMLFTLFVFTKLFEGVVTVEGENFDTSREEIMYYDLVYDSLEVQNEIFDYLIKRYSEKNLNNDIRIIQLYLSEKNAPNNDSSVANMLLKMKDSLEDNEMGSLTKEKSNQGYKYVRKYPS